MTLAPPAPARAGGGLQVRLGTLDSLGQPDLEVVVLNPSRVAFKLLEMLSQSEIQEGKISRFLKLRSWHSQ